MFLKLLRKVNSFLRNDPVRQPGELIPMDDDWWDSFNSINRPWFTNVYWAIYRFFKNTKIFHPRDVYYGIKYFVSRGHRGWADCDTWSLDNYLSEWLPDALRYLKAHKHGIPCDMFDGLPTENDDGFTHSPETYKIAEDRWNGILDKMIAGFEANNRLSDLLYEPELGSYPLDRPKGVSKEDWKKVRGDHSAASDLLMKRDEKIFQEGMALFVKHFKSLWD